MRIKGVMAHVGQAVLEGALLAGLVGMLAVGTTFAAKPQSSTSGVSISMPSGLFAQPDTATVSGKSGAWVYVNCSQGGHPAMFAYETTDSNGQATFTMGPTSSWTSGSASCVAQAGHWDRRSNWVTDATTSFTVSG